VGGVRHHADVVYVSAMMWRVRTRLGGFRGCGGGGGVGWVGVLGGVFEVWVVVWFCCLFGLGGGVGVGWGWRFGVRRFCFMRKRANIPADRR